MSIVYPLTPPATPVFKGITLKHTDVVGSSRSPFTREAQFYRHQGQILQGSMRLPVMLRPEAEDWIAFLLSLKGMSGTFLMGIAGCDTARGTLGGVPLVNGAGQTGETLALDGASNSITNWLKAGDWFQLGTGLNTHLHKNLTNANSNGSGQVNLDVWPRLRVSPADNDPIVISSPKGLWRLATNDIDYDLSPPLLFDMEFPVIEAI
jgi:hypothetical protein